MAPGESGDWGCNIEAGCVAQAHAQYVSSMGPPRFRENKKG